MNKGKFGVGPRVTYIGHDLQKLEGEYLGMANVFSYTNGGLYESRIVVLTRSGTIWYCEPIMVEFLEIPDPGVGVFLG